MRCADSVCLYYGLRVCWQIKSIDQSINQKGVTRCITNKLLRKQAFILWDCEGILFQFAEQPMDIFCIVCKQPGRVKTIVKVMLEWIQEMSVADKAENFLCRQKETPDVGTTYNSTVVFPQSHSVLSQNKWSVSYPGASIFSALLKHPSIGLPARDNHALTGEVTGCEIAEPTSTSASGAIMALVLSSCCFIVAPESATNTNRATVLSDVSSVAHELFMSLALSWITARNMWCATDAPGCEKRKGCVERRREKFNYTVSHLCFCDHWEDSSHDPHQSKCRQYRSVFYSVHKLCSEHREFIYFWYTQIYL